MRPSFLARLCPLLAGLVLGSTCVAISPVARAQAEVEWERLPDLHPGGDNFRGIAWLSGLSPGTDTLLAFRSAPFRFNAATQTWTEMCPLPCSAFDLLVTHHQTLLITATAGPTKLDRSTDGGRTWEKEVARKWGGDVLFEADLAAFRDSLGGSAVFAASGTVIRSLNDGAFHTWGPERSALQLIRDLAELPPSTELPTGRLLAGILNGVSYSEDAGETWHPSGLFAQGGYVAETVSVAPDPEHRYGGVIYASGTAFGPRRGYLARSYDGGATWEGVLTVNDGDFGLEDPIQVLSIVVDDGKGGTEIWASAAHAAGSGPRPAVLLRSDNGGDDWVVAEERGGLPPLHVNEFAMARDGRLYAATGRGLWRTVEPVGRPWPGVTPVSSAPEPPEMEPLGLTVEPNPATGVVTARWRVRQAGAVRVSVYDARGREVLVLTEGHRQSGEQSAEVDTSSLAPGVYVVRVSTEASTASASFTVAR